MRLAWHPRPHSLSSAGLWQPRPGQAPPHTAADIYSYVPFPALSQLPRALALPEAIWGIKKFRNFHKNWNCPALILKSPFTVFWLGAGEVGRNEFLIHFSLALFALQCLHLPTAHPQGPITVQLPTPPHLPLLTPPHPPPPTPLPRHQPIPPRQPRAITPRPQ